MKELQKEILELQKMDTLSLAEKITGNEHKEDGITTSLGLLLHLKKGKEMRYMLSKIDDTQFSENVSNYLRIVCNYGFEVVFKEPFMNETIEENLYVLFHKELGILICFDSYTWGKDSVPNVNGGNMYYNWSPNSFETSSDLRSSGHYHFAYKGEHMTLFEEDMVTQYKIKKYPKSVDWDYANQSLDQYNAIQTPIREKQTELFNAALGEGKRMLWIGGHDCREGIITTIEAMRENGKFFPQWHECPFSWLTNFMEHKIGINYPYTEYYEATKSRIAKMPKHVKDCIGETYKK